MNLHMRPGWNRPRATRIPSWSGLYFAGMSKRPSKRIAAELPWWKVIRPKGTPAAEIGRVQALDADEAIKIAIEQIRGRACLPGTANGYQVRR